MKKCILIITIITFSTIVQAQKKKTVDEFDFTVATKKDYKSYKNGFDTKTLITGFGTFKLGDGLTISQPSDVNLNEFSFIGLGKFSIMNAMAMTKMARANANTSVVIDKIRVYKPAMGQPASIIVDIISEDGSNLGGIYKRGNILNLERAVATGEVSNPNAPLNREQAIAKLKEAKDLMELDMMTQDEFDELRKKLTPIIKGN
tara:strand:+ start:284 stop:892 length:609 start_codon:yes stop_codon:yes gene_type:complete